MNNRNLKLLWLILASLFCSIAIATAQEAQYQQRTMPDGSVESTYTQSDGSKITHLQRADGSSISTSVDKNGKTTISTQSSTKTKS